MKLALGILLSFLGGCGGLSMRFMVKATQPQPLVARNDRALVVFVRPSTTMGDLVGKLIDERGNFMGESTGGAHFAVSIAPGKHTFVIWAENMFGNPVVSDALTAELNPGKTYFVEIPISVDAVTARVHLRALKPGLQNWNERQRWLAQTQRYDVNFADGNAELREKGTKAADVLRRGQEDLAKFDQRERFEHTLAPGDGL